MRFEKTIFGRGMKWLAGFGVIVCVAATTVAAPSHDQTILDRPPPAAKAPRDLVAEFRRGPMASVEKLVFAVRRSGEDPHWYANFGYTLDHSNWRTYLDGGRLCVLDVATGKVAVLLDDPRGNVRDPQVDYDGRSVVFAYRPGGTVHYHLYEMRLDGSGLRQITDGPFDDVEPTWLPDGDLMFVSTRCRRRVNCHTTQTAVLYRCRRDGTAMRELSSNNEHDNTPWPLPNGQILYTRWEYVDRNQMAFHHLWTANPDGTRQTVYYGNMLPETTMIDAKPIPGSRKIVASFSPGHGIRDHDGYLTVVDPRRGPDDPASARRITRTYDFRDPWAFSETTFLAARGAEIVLVDDTGASQALYRLPAAGYQCHEPRPVAARSREPVVRAASDWSQATGRVVVADVTRGRNMGGVRPGEIKKLLLLETLPKPMNYTGGMEPISYGGTFTLERILGTIPVEEDGSAYAEVPALRSLFFVALDEKERSIKRMQSFLCVAPGETISCVGCHEKRSQTPPRHAAGVRGARPRPAASSPSPASPTCSTTRATCNRSSTAIACDATTRTTATAA